MGRQQVQAMDLQAKVVRETVVTSCLPVTFFPCTFIISVKFGFEHRKYSEGGCLDNGTFFQTWKGVDVSHCDLLLLRD